MSQLIEDTPSTPDASARSAWASPAGYRVLARKYRPQTFADLIGQETMVRILRNAFAQGRVAHAFMLTGVRGVGKTTTARIIARALNCTGPDGNGGPTADPCGVCANCTAILADRHPDVVEMDAASRTGVDDVREIIEATRFRPLQARTKVFIVDEVHMLSRNAFNALLKTLEEPPPHVKFIFATTELRKVPLTVLSRCQRFDLRRVSVKELIAHFGRIAEAEHIAVEPEALALLARAADGSVRDGLSLLDQAIAQAEGGGPVTAAAVNAMLGLADRAQVFDLLEAVMAGRVAEALAQTEAAYARGADLGMLLQDMLEILHTVSRMKFIPELRQDLSLSETDRTRSAALAEALSVPVLGRAWQMLLKGLAEVEAAPDRRAAAEMVLIRLCHVADLPPPGELVRRLEKAEPKPAPAGLAPPDRRAPRTASPTEGIGATALAIPEPSAASLPADKPRLTSFRDVVALAAAEREALLHARLTHMVHLVRFAPPVLELRLEPDAPRDLVSQLASLLQRSTGERWTIALSHEEGEPTLAEQEKAADAARRRAAAQHPLVQAILEAFPGARIDAVHPEAEAETRDASGEGTGSPVPSFGEDAAFAALAPSAGEQDDQDELTEESEEEME
ncbi:MAG: DNA polymerase III subunit gamma/tau [Acidobacteriia bacterium]|nr:DNA polymerase III subunit gamma/tau [Methyloceanibacter sp.]MCL6490693.1 DNA polymerase III subunit gamma/tau [Terriglobia bacterium]